MYTGWFKKTGTLFKYVNIHTSNANCKTSDIYTSIIDFPNLWLTYNGGWCTATKLGETLISRPSCEVNVNRERVRCFGAVYLSSNQMLE